MIDQYVNRSIDYKRHVASRYTAIQAEEITKKMGHVSKFLVSLKYDGHFYTILYTDNQAHLINRNGKQLERMFLHEAIEKYLQEKGVKQVFAAAELYVKTDKRTRQFNVTKAVSEGGDDLKLAVYDLLELDDSSYQEKLVFERFEKLTELFGEHEHIHVAEHFITENIQEIGEYFKEQVTIGGYEGLVVKSEGFVIYKIKPTFTFDAVVIGYAQSDGHRSELLRDLLLAFRKEDGSYQIFAHLSHGFNEDDRRRLVKELEQKVVRSDYLEVARNKLGFKMVVPDTVVEFSCIDIINQDSKGSILKMNLMYDPKKGYSATYPQPSVSVTIPLFLRFREDKQPTIEDTHFEQVMDAVAFDDFDLVTEADLPKTEVLKREVYTKESRGALMIRKFLLLKTNKEKHADYPAYVCHITDFSSGRKDPLKKDVKVSDSKEQIEEIFTQALEANIKKGWEKV